MGKWLWLLLVVLASCASAATPNSGPPPRDLPTAFPESLPYIEPLAAMTRDNIAQIRLIGRLQAPGTPSTVFRHAFSPDGTLLAGLNNDWLIVWDLISGETLYHITRGSAAWLYFSPDKSEIYTIAPSGLVEIWDATNGQARNDFRGHADFADILAYDAERGYLAMGGLSGEIKVWDVAARQSLVTFSANPGRITSLAFSPDGQWLAAGSEDHVMRLWDWRERRLIRAYDHQGANVNRIVFRPDGDQIATATDRYIALWDANSDTLSAVLETDEGGASDVLAYSPDGRFIVNGGLAPFMNIWDSASGALIGSFPDINGGRVSATFSPDSQLIITSQLDGPVFLWDLSQMKAETLTRANVDFGSTKILTADWSDDGFTLILIDATGPIYVWGIGAPAD